MPSSPQKDVVSSFSTPWLRLASTRAEFEQTATGLLTKLEKGLQSAQEALFLMESKETELQLRNKEKWSWFCEGSSTLPYLWCIFSPTNLTELFLLLPLAMFLLRKLQIWKDFLQHRWFRVWGMFHQKNPKQPVSFVDVWWFPSILHVQIWWFSSNWNNPKNHGLFGVPLPRGGPWRAVLANLMGFREAHQRVQEAMGNYRRSSIQVRPKGMISFLSETLVGWVI